ncbi:hypothetical protein GCM10010123_34490 [Pilimelia anulata]|uniref:N-acetyltransferase domain-containing protein n=1 Tax=Pilimelia anulata TaxID=53371 RepID=A0A8J3BAW3_9ACTN|nr:GNAT family N-acetyltransferase [Pilimelia anulata]GGK01711.1 hypothetical protein GCM10010123_34490 [Pilimelia anulata]
MERRLLHHLAGWLGQWPPLAPLQVVGSGRRLEPGWDGRTHPAIAVGHPGGLLLSVPPVAAPEVRRAAGIARPDADADAARRPAYAGGAGAPAGPAPGPPRPGPPGLPDHLPALVGYPRRRLYAGVFRWTGAPAALPEAGEWLPAGDPALPVWLAAYDSPVLVVRDPDTGAYLAGVGVRRHTACGHELAVDVAPAARGRGLARRLFAAAARRSLDEGAVPTYVHDPGDAAAAGAAAAAGFAERGWRYHDLSGSVQ